MNILDIASTEKSPKIYGNIEDGYFEVTGRSLPEDSLEFYLPVREWLDELLQSNIPSIQVKLHIEYFNTSSSKFFMDVVRDLKSASATKNVSIQWIYDIDDYEMEQTGASFHELFGDIIELIPVRDEEF